MTESKADRHGGKRTAPRTCWRAYALEVDKMLAATGGDGKWRWPNARYRQDILGFCREVLGIEPWERQAEALLAIQNYRRVAIRAGRKVSKSCTDGIAALWWMTCWFDAKCIMTAPTARQVEAILWEEVRKMHLRSQNPLDPEDPSLKINPALVTRPIDGECMFLARSGLRVGFREIVGFTAREGVTAAGTSGAHQFYILDEASGIPDEIYAAIIGNMAGGGKLLLTGNPTTDEGEFFEAFNAKALSDTNQNGYKTLTISSEESPNVVARSVLYPGLAEYEWIEERKQEWGVDSALYQIHVLGKPVTVESGKIISLNDIRQAEERWSADGRFFVEPVGVLHIGVDPAFSTSGDEAVFVARRGKRVLEIRADRGLRDADAHLAIVRDMAKVHGVPGDVAVVNLDALGDVGSQVQYHMRDYADKHPREFVLCALRASDTAQREPAGYVRMRDELWGSLAMWLREGGAIPEDLKLERDLHSPSWGFDVQNRKIATAKKELRRMLGRSPDRGDALALAVWENSVMAEREHAMHKMRAQPASQVRDEPAAQGIDPYAGMDQWQERREV